MNATQTGPHTGRSADPRNGDPRGGTHGTGTQAGDPRATDPRNGDPRIGWSATEAAHTPALRHRRDGILPTIAAALSVRGGGGGRGCGL
ncbi:hypothetical protein K4G64_38945, partial [Streptomyces sp. WAC04114]|nr:hypothetical protein [Streptomyces sp. WAC04114]